MGRRSDGQTGDQALPAGEVEALLAELDPGAALAVLDAAKSEPALVKDAAAFFRRQAQLANIQIQNAHAQTLIDLSHAKLRRFTDRLGAATQVFFVIVATAVGLGLALMLHDAFNSKSVIVEAFDAPAALAPSGVTTHLALANARGPHWADPLKAWGDVLARQGHWPEALAKYDAALKYAPAWKALQAARGLAAGH